MPGPRVVPVPFESAAQLVAELDVDLGERYGFDGEMVHVLATDFEEPRGRFFVACLEDRPVGCAGIRQLSGATAELKRMYVRREARGRGLARALLTACERSAREIGYTDIWLETGDGQPEAVALYLSAGYQPVPAFGQYQGSPRSITLGKRLAGGG